MLTEMKLDCINEARLNKAIELQQTDQADQAITQYQMILSDYPQHAMVMHLQAITLAQVGQIDDAIELFRQVVDLHPNHPIYLSSLANALRRKGELDHAIDYFQQALSHCPTLVSAHNNLALIYFKSDPQLAQHHFQQALQTKPDHLDANYNLGLLLLSTNKHKAKHHFTTAIQVKQDFVPALFQLAQLFHSEKAFLKARNTYERILLLKPNDPDCLYKMGLICLEQDQFDEGLDFLQQAYASGTQLDDIEHNLACLYLHQKNYQKALEFWLKHIKSPNADLESYYNVGVCYLYLGRYDDATDYLFHVIKKQLDHYHALINLGATFLQKNHPQSACEYYERAQAIKPSSAISYVLDALQQKQSPATAPTDYVVDLFDSYAFRYDEHLCDVLDYQLPKRLAHIIPAHLNFPERSCMTLDLGCGTGLCGQLLHGFSRSLIGIDLSPNMLDIARKKSFYDDLICADICVLQEAFKHQIDFILTADTLPYIGDLDPVFKVVQQYLKPGGYWIFSIEENFSDDYVLTQSARFSHHPDYIDRLSRDHRLSLFHQERTALRTQQNAYVDGLIYILKAPS